MKVKRGKGCGKGQRSRTSITEDSWAENSRVLAMLHGEAAILLLEHEIINLLKNIIKDRVSNRSTIW